MSEDRKYVPPNQRDIDQMVDLYAKVDRLPMAPPTGPERTVKDPFGFNEAAPDPLEAAKEVTTRLVRFFMLASNEFRLDAEGMIFAAELAALNILNAKDMPLSPAKLAEVRNKAYAYYVASLAQIPDPKPAPPPRRR